MKHTNFLINETSPYLLQHAHNPVNWFAWNEETLNKAKQEDKLILISIGYSACHWCHVMEHECFEDEQVAEVMNKYFINIKIDREERPDIDQVYMSAVQLMSGQGGWPLNCFALPDGRPIYGGTYFPKQQWVNILQNVAAIYQNNRNKAEEYAAELTNGILRSELIIPKEEIENLNIDILHETVNNWAKRFDNTEGGPQKAPKFPLPNNYLFLLRYAHLCDNHSILKHVNLTLQKMAAGGIYDHLGGGFARYSVDDLWKVPHFEKMLYDNAQLVSLYAEAYQCTQNERYKEVVEETLDFIKKEFTSTEFAFYSALDADSEGVEGKYYVWEQDELKKILKNDFTLFADYYNINQTGYWEEDHYILLRQNNDAEIALKHQLSITEIRKTINDCKTKLLLEREKRIKPGLDDKCLTSWNALMLKAYCDAYRVLGNNEYLDIAYKNAKFILEKQLRKDGGLNHNYKNGKSTINGFLEDYTFVIDAFIALYQCSGDETYLSSAQQLCTYTIQHFHDKNTGLFYFTSTNDAALIARKTEISDNVIPASNSQMAKNLLILANYSDKPEYKKMAKKMLNSVLEEMKHYGSGYSNWAMLLLELVKPTFEIAIVGKHVNEKFIDLQKHYLPNSIFAMSKQASSMPLLKNRFVEGKTLIYVCKNNACKLPTEDIDEAIEQLNEGKK